MSAVCLASLPDPLKDEDGRSLPSSDWPALRTDVRDLLLSIQYGTLPDRPQNTTARPGAWQTEENGWRSRVDRLTFTPRTDSPNVSFDLDITLTLPSAQAVASARERIPNYDENGLPVVLYVGGTRHHSVLNSGYALVNYPNDTLEPMEMGKPAFGPARRAYANLFGENHYTWGSIAAWAWGALRVADYVRDLPDLNGERIALTGHSRNGKTALLAGALDEQIALVNPAGSGCAGAGSYLVLGPECEDLAALTSRERWWAWTHPEFENWAGREAELPFDQHWLMSLVAPRPILRTEGFDDAWANPIGTSATFLATQRVYDLLGVPERNCIHYRDGGHTHSEEDAACLIALCDETFFGAPRSLDLSQIHPETPPTDTFLT